MSFPTIVYRSPGPHHGEFGKTYQSKGVSDAEALAAALADGWCKTLPEACGHKPAPVATVVAAPEPSDRELLETKARLMGIDFDGRTSDRRLADRIAAAMVTE